MERDSAKVTLQCQFALTNGVMALFWPVQWGFLQGKEYIRASVAKHQTHDVHFHIAVPFHAGPQKCVCLQGATQPTSLATFGANFSRVAAQLKTEPSQKISGGNNVLRSRETDVSLISVVAWSIKAKHSFQAVDICQTAEISLSPKYYLN